MAKNIIFIHGRNYKPDANFLKRSWTESLGYGLERDKDYRAIYDNIADVFSGPLSFLGVGLAGLTG